MPNGHKAVFVSHTQTIWLQSKKLFALVFSHCKSFFVVFSGICLAGAILICCVIAVPRLSRRGRADPRGSRWSLHSSIHYGQIPQKQPYVYQAYPFPFVVLSYCSIVFWSRPCREALPPWSILRSRKRNSTKTIFFPDDLLSPLSCPFHSRW